MVSGFDRYYQIARCFRDEDLRADRQPEFTQIDIETAFLTGEEVMSITEGMVRSLFKEQLDVDLGDFPRMTWADAMERYGSDKPDLRIDWELVSIDDLMSEVDFKVFSGPAQDPESVWRRSRCRVVLHCHAKKLMITLITWVFMERKA